MKIKTPYEWAIQKHGQFLIKASLLFCLILSVHPVNGFCGNSNTELRAKELINLTVSEIIAPLLRETLPENGALISTPYRANQSPRRSRDLINEDLKKICRALNILMGNALGVDIEEESNKALLRGFSQGGCATAATAVCAAAAHASGILNLQQFATTIGAFNITVVVFGLAAAPGLAASIGTEIFYDTKNYVLLWRLKGHLRRALIANGLNGGQISYFEAVFNQTALEARDAKEHEVPHQFTALPVAATNEVHEPPTQDCHQALQGQQVRISLTQEPAKSEDVDAYQFGLILYRSAMAGNGRF